VFRYIVLYYVFDLIRNRRSADKQTNAQSNLTNQSESNYTDLQNDPGAASTYTELQTRNDEHSSIEVPGQAYVNTQVYVNAQAYVNTQLQG